MQFILIMIGGAIGSVSRYILANCVHAVMPRDFPFGTLVVNCLGCFLMGLLFILIFERFSNFSEQLRAFVLIGFLGGFTTFSTFSIETFNLLENGDIGRACANIVTSVSFCILLTWLGILLGRKI